MTIAELIVGLDFKVSGLDDLTKMDAQMKSIASNARDAVIALRQLARVQLPKQFIPQNGGVPRITPGGGAGILGGLVPVTGPANVAAGTSIKSANILIQSARILVQEGNIGGGGGRGGGGVIPSAAGGSELGSLAKLGFGLLGAASLVAVLRGLISGLKDMVQTSRQAVFATDKLTSSTGLSLKELKRWEYLGSKANVPGVFEQALQHLNDQRARAAAFPGSVNLAPYSLAHVDFTQDAGTQLRQFFKNTAGMSQSVAQSYASALGLDPSIVYARKFLNGDGSLPEAAGAALTDQQQKAVMELNGAWQDMTFNISSLASKLTADLAPALKEVIGIITKGQNYLISHDDARKSFNAFAANPAGLLAAGIPLAFNLMYADATRRGLTTDSKTVHMGGMNITNHGIRDQEVLGKIGTTVDRAVSDALYSEQPAAANH